MKSLIIFIICVCLYLISAAQTNIRLIIKSDPKIDSIGMIDISQREFHQGLFKDSVDFKFNKNNVDLYRIRYLINGKLYWKLAWLDTGSITVKAHTSNTDLIITSKYGAPIYQNIIIIGIITGRRKSTSCLII